MMMPPQGFFPQSRRGAEQDGVIFRENTSRVGKGAWLGIREASGKKQKTSARIASFHSADYEYGVENGGPSSLNTSTP